MKLPNLLIAGAPKCGTSSIFTWLIAHPEVCGSQPKETFYLMNSDSPLCNSNLFYDIGRLEKYSQYFDHCSSWAKVICEATTHYIYQQKCIDVVKTLPCRPQIIFILRQPEQRVYSSFQYTKNNLGRFNIDITFSKYIEIINSQSFETFQKYCSHPSSSYVLFNDIKFSCYINYLERWKSFFPDNIHIMLFEDMLRDKQEFMKKIARINNIDPSFYDNYDYPLKNDTYNVKNKLIHRWSYYFSKILRDNFKTVLKNTYMSMQKSNVISHKTVKDQETLLQLSDYFLPFNEKLANVFNLDLSVWM